VWSGRTGPVVATSGESAFSLEGACVVAFKVSDGHELWSWRDQRHPYLAGVVASQDVVVVASGTTVGTAPAAVFPVVNHLFGLDAATGRQLWSRTIRNHGQSVPAVFASSHLVLSLASGTVLGLDPATGSTVWSDRGQVRPGG
jgi:outer membrane protein assembly factor BamB